jgi:hypothetical protein
MNSNLELAVLAVMATLVVAGCASTPKPPPPQPEPIRQPSPAYDPPPSPPFVLWANCDPQGAEVHGNGMFVGYCRNGATKITYPLDRATIAGGVAHVEVTAQWPSGARRQVQRAFDPAMGRVQDLWLLRPKDNANGSLSPGELTDNSFAWEFTRPANNLSYAAAIASAPVPPPDLGFLREALAPPPRVDVYLHPPSILEGRL